jgi:hypothetical protein
LRASWGHRFLGRRFLHGTGTRLVFVMIAQHLSLEVM